MYCLIKGWPSKNATLMTEDSVVLWTLMILKKPIKYGKIGVLYKMLELKIKIPISANKFEV